MTVKEAIAHLAYGEVFYLKGAYSGKILYHSQKNKKERLERFLNWNCPESETTGGPFFADLYTPKYKYNKPYTYPVIGIWVSDYGMDGGKEE